MAKIKDESNARDDAKLPQRENTRTRNAREEDQNGFAVNDPNRPSHPDGWQTGGRGDNNR
jgi:hypothetical protein